MHSMLPDAYVALHMHACSCTLTMLLIYRCALAVWRRVFVLVFVAGSVVLLSHVCKLSSLSLCPVTCC